MRTPRVLAGTLGLIALWACSGPRVGPAIDAGPIGDTATLSAIQEKIFTPKCATSSCHAPDPPPQAPMTLEAGLSFANLVGVASFQAPALARVEPGDPSRSYLVHKLRGTSSTVGGAATRMPLLQAPLEEEEIMMVEEWIRRGAPND